MNVPPIPLFAGERVVGGWRAHYLYRDEGVFRPPRWLASTRNRWMTGREDAIEGELHLTTWRLVFSARPGRWHPMQGHFSLFLSRLWGLSYDASPVIGIFHMGSKAPRLWGHSFRLPWECEAALLKRYQEVFVDPVALRTEFEESVQCAWWRAGLGLRASERLGAGPFSSSGEVDDYRTSGEEPSFERLSAQLKGIEGEGLAQLRWLMQPGEPESGEPPPQPVSQRRCEGGMVSPGPNVYAGVRKGRALEVAGEERVSELRGKVW